jgi:hypothetical protein
MAMTPRIAAMRSLHKHRHSLYGHPHVFIDSKKLMLPFGVSRNLPSRNSIPSTVPIGLRIRRKTYIFFNMSGGTSNSSLRVPEGVMSMAGEGPLVGHLAVENDFRIAGAFEFLENHFVHTQPGQVAEAVLTNLALNYVIIIAAACALEHFRAKWTPVRVKKMR